MYIVNDAVVDDSVKENYKRERWKTRQRVEIAILHRRAKNVLAGMKSRKKSVLG